MIRFVEVRVPDFRKIFEGEKDVVYYNIRMTFGGKEWSVSKRYSEMEKFNIEISVNHAQIPSFPSKSLIPFLKQDEIEPRRNQLELYLKVK